MHLDHIRVGAHVRLRSGRLDLEVVHIDPEAPAPVIVRGAGPSGPFTFGIHQACLVQACTAAPQA